MLALLRTDLNFRRFIVAHAQSQLGTGASYVALLVVAYQRLHSGWGVSAVLIGDFLPGMVLGPLFGALSDRLPRRRLAIAGDVVGLAAFAGLALVPSFAATVGFALLAGTGAALARSAMRSALPDLTAPEQRSVAAALWGLCRDVGVTLGPVLTALLLLFVSPTVILAANGITFGLSALVLLGVNFGQAVSAGEDQPPPSLVTQLREGMATIAHLPDLSVVMVAGSLTALAGGLMNRVRLSWRDVT